MEDRGWKAENQTYIDLVNRRCRKERKSVVVGVVDSTPLPIPSSRGVRSLVDHNQGTALCARMPRAAERVEGDQGCEDAAIVIESMDVRFAPLSPTGLLCREAQIL